MFSGLVGGLGKLVRREPLEAGVRFVLEQPFGPLELGESIAVNGVCLTVVEHDTRTFAMDLSPETLDRTTLGTLVEGARVNLERALLVTDRLGGHLVSGHVDGVGEIVEVRALGEMSDVRLRVPDELGRYVAEKGSITVDGVSLTVNAVEGALTSLLLIPHTRQVTTLGELAPGRRVNVEVDLVARYVERLLSFR